MVRANGPREPVDHKRAAPADDEPDDGGLFERTIGALPGAKS